MMKKSSILLIVIGILIVLFGSILIGSYNKMVTSKGVHSKAAQKPHVFEKRMLRHPEYYVSNSLISSTFDFLHLVIDNWFPIA